MINKSFSICDTNLASLVSACIPTDTIGTLADSCLVTERPNVPYIHCIMYRVFLKIWFLSFCKEIDKNPPQKLAR